MIISSSRGNKRIAKIKLTKGVKRMLMETKRSKTQKERIGDCFAALNRMQL